MMTTRRRPFERPVGRPVDDVAHLVDLDRAAVARLDDQDVGVDAAGDARTRRAAPAGVESAAHRRQRPGGGAVDW